MKPYLCIYHGNCADGFTSAWVVRRALGEDKVDFYPGVYNDEPPWELIKDRNVIFVDFTYKLAKMEKVLANAENILVLDHHKSAEQDLLALAPRHTLGMYFDMKRSGARMAWDYFFPDVTVPNLIRFVEDRDLWIFQYPETRAFNTYLFSKTYTFENWDELYRLAEDEKGLTAAVKAGEAIDEKHFKDIMELLAVCKYEMIIGGIKVPVANLPYTMSSDAANILAKSHESKMGACYYETGAHRVFSLRSLKDGPDVSKIASGYGGGGHAQASGFRVAKGWEGDV